MTRILFGTLAAAAVVLSTRALAAVPTDTVVTATTLRASKPIYMLAADETHVAVAYEARRNCIESWDVAKKKLVRFTESSCESAPTSEDTSVFGLAVGASRLAWAGGMFTLHDWEWVNTATTKATKDINVFGMEDEGVVYGPFGDADLIVFSYTADWERPAQGTLYRVLVTPRTVDPDGSCDKCSVELRGDLAALAVDDGRIATRTRSARSSSSTRLGMSCGGFHEAEEGRPGGA